MIFWFSALFANYANFVDIWLGSFYLFCCLSDVLTEGILNCSHNAGIFNKCIWNILQLLGKSLNRSGNYVSNFVTCVMCVLFVPIDEKFKCFPKCSLCTSFFRKTFLRVKMSPLPWGDRWSVFICSKYLLGNICHHGKGLKIQNTSFLQKKNVELICKFHRATQNFPIRQMVKLWVV